MRYFYFDLGAGDGGTISSFLNNGIIPLIVLQENWICIAYEPTPWPACEQTLDSLRNTFPKTKIELRKEAVWIRNETREFSVQYFHREGSSTLLPECKEYSLGQVVTVPCVDFPEILLETCSKNDQVVIKMDIEGAEYEILNKMIDNGSINLVSTLFVEFHDFILPEKYKEMEMNIRDRCPIPINKWD